MKKTLFFVMAVMMFAACHHENNQTSYAYKVQLDSSLGNCISNEMDAIQNAFDKAVGYDGNAYLSHESPIDDEIKAACEAVKAKYANVQSVYLKYKLYRITKKPASNEATQDFLDSYEIGRALTTPYFTYSFTSNEEEAFAALEALKPTITDQVYRASWHTLRRLIGYHSSAQGASFAAPSLFEQRLVVELAGIYEGNTAFEANLVRVCDSIAEHHVNDTLAVDASLSLTKNGLLNGQSTAIWSKSFPHNISPGK